MWRGPLYRSIFLACRTPRQERFAQAIAAGKNGPQASREAGYAANPHAARVNASRRLAKTSVAARVAELQAEHAAKNAITVDGQLSKLEEVRLQAIEDRNQSAAVAAIVAENKLCGLIIDKAQVETIVRRPAPDVDRGVIMSEDEWQQRIALASPVSTMTTNAHAAASDD
jgi:phage terminase small subunit